MAKRTVLSMAQSILSAMSSTDVNGLSDTTEATQVANIIRDTYEEMMSQRDWPHLKRLYKLTALSDNNFPTTFQIPSQVSYIDWIKYNKKEISTDADLYSNVKYLEPLEFIEVINNRRTDNPNVTVYNDNISGIPLNIVTDTAPTYWTSFDNEYIIMDSFDSEVDSTLQESKTQTYATKNTSWSEDDSHIPDLPEKMFPLLLAESTETALLRLRQIADNKEAAKARRQNNVMQHTSRRQNHKPKWNSYGRK